MAARRSTAPAPSRSGLLAPAVALMLALRAGQPAQAHGLEWALQGDGRVVVAFRYLGGAPMQGVAARVFRPGEPDAPAFATTADEAGRVAFTADRDGVWRVDLIAADGHVDRTLVTVQDGVPATPGSPLLRWLLAASLTCNLLTFLLVAAPRLRALRAERPRPIVLTERNHP